MPEKNTYIPKIFSTRIAQKISTGIPEPSSESWITATPQNSKITWAIK